MPAISLDRILPSITWALVHSLWQGLILTVLAGIVLLLTRRSKAAIRYAFLCGLFFVFLGGVAFTFFWEWNHEMVALQTSGASDNSSGFLLFSIDNWQASATFFFNQHAQAIVLTWLLVLVFQAGRMLREIAYIRELRHRKVHAVEPFLLEKMQALAKELRIRKTVALVESAAVKVPIVIGHLKPLVMMPVGMLNHLSPGEVEAVLLHELAHIRRHDYLVNYLQRIAEIFLFFNPGMLWVSSLLRAEREACCDEVAICGTGNKLQFVEALIRCKEHALETPAFSLGLFGNKNLLLQRLNRIVSNRNESLSVLEATFFSVSILFLLTIFSGWNDIADSAVNVESAPMVKTSDTTKKLVAQIDEKPMQNEIKRLNENRKTSHTKGASDRQTIHRSDKQKNEAVSNIYVDQLNYDLYNHPLQQTNDQLDNQSTIYNDAERQEMESLKAHADLYRTQMQKARYQAEIDRALVEIERKQADRERERINQYREQAQKDRLRAERDRIEIQKLREQQYHQWPHQTIQ